MAWLMDRDQAKPNKACEDFNGDRSESEEQPEAQRHRKLFRPVLHP